MQKRPGVSHFLPLMNICNLILTLIALVALGLAPRGFLSNHPTLVSLTCAIPFGSVTIDYLTTLFSEQYRLRLVILARLCFALMNSALVMCLIASNGLLQKLTQMLWVNGRPGGVVYFCFLITITFFNAILAGSRLAKYKKDKAIQLHSLIASCAMGCGFLYFAILVFANNVFPFISCAKGGGDYSEACHVNLLFRPETSDHVTKEVIGNLASNPTGLLLLDENGTSFFVAFESDAGGPKIWQQDPSSRPTVYEIRRDAITSISYLNPKR